MMGHRFRSILLVAGLSLAGCAQPPQEAAPTPRDSAEPMPAANAPAAPAMPGTADPGTSIASLPDKGVLLEYGAGVEQDPARGYALHPVQISEAHAFAALRGGELVVPTPDGRQVRLRSVRYEDLQDGNWTWVGRSADGDLAREAVITFGPDAVFGSIPQAGGPPLQITTRAGKTYLLVGDPDRFKPALPRENDGRLPPAADPDAADGMMMEQLAEQVTTAVDAEPAASGDVRDATPTAAAAPPKAVATALPRDTIDLLIGYTRGFRIAQGSQSVARTRLNYLVAVANQALVNSRVSATIRVVGMVEVDYADDTGNSPTLDELTSGVPALAPLQIARDRYGADLVSLVRQFDNDEHGGCGVAWTLGAGGYEITPGSAGYGFSVVSDGSSGGYYCTDDTLAHEVGHNLGLHHDIDSAGGQTGRYPYSYGYRTDASKGSFRTVMAYWADGWGDNLIRIFSNPDVKSCSGYACGVAGAADNSRTLRQTIPAVSVFRSVMVPYSAGASGDYDGNGRDDVLWRNAGSGDNTIWLAADKNNRRATDSIASQEWRVAAVGDHDGNGRDDILWRNFATGQNMVWPEGRYASRKSLTSLGNLDWKVVGFGDFDGDGKDDILWRNFSNGSNVVWPSGNYAARRSLTRISSLDWMVMGVADFNGDGRDDVLWRNAGSGANTIWLSGDYATRQSQKGISNLDWKVVGVGDFNGDGRADIFWRNTATGAHTIWLSGRYETRMATAGLASQSWRVVGVGDYNGDGRADVFWRNSATGGNNVWYSGSYDLRRNVGTIASPAWEVVP